MAKSLVNSFVGAVNDKLPTLSTVGEVVGFGLGNAAKFADKLIAGIHDLAMGRESAGMSNLASSSPRVSQQTVAASKTVPFATRDLEAEDGAKAKTAPSAKSALKRVAEGYSKGFAEGRAPDTPKPKAAQSKPTLAPG